MSQSCKYMKQQNKTKQKNLRFYLVTTPVANVKNPNSNLGSSDEDHDSNEEFQNETNYPGSKNDATTIVSPVVAVDSEIPDHMEIYSIHSFTSEDNMPLCDDDQSSNDILFDPDEFLVEPIQSTSPQPD